MSDSRSIAQRPVERGSLNPVYIAGSELTDANGNNSVSFGDSVGLDAFGRLRVSEPFTIFDSKQTLDNLPLVYDDQQVSGSGTTSTHSANLAASTMAVSASTAGRRVRQSFRHFNYEPGKSQLILLTFSNIESQSGITKLVGYGNDNNGIFLVHEDGVAIMRRRSFVTGSAVDVDIPQASWSNADNLPAIDFSLAQIFFIDFEWLGVGRVRTGFVINGQFHVAHEFLNANNLNTVYMSTPNLPVRYEIENDGTGGADDLIHICSSVVSEGGTNTVGKTAYISLADDLVNANTIGTIYALMGMRATIGASIKINRISVLSPTNDDFEWLLVLDPTVAGGGLTWSTVTNFGFQQGLPDTVGNPSATTVTGGTIIDGGYVTGGGDKTLSIFNALEVGSAIDGTQNECVLCARPRTINMDIQGSMTIRELS